jgi:hypothetical protein
MRLSVLAAGRFVMEIIRKWTIAWIAMTVPALSAQVFAQEAQAPAEAEPPAASEAPPAEPVFSQEQIDQMIAPIALYPDALLAQILMASTYPLEIVQAARWLGENSKLEGEALDKAVSQESWDPSVQSLVFFPSVLERMNDNLDWTQDLGDAFLAQQDDVLGAVQRLRQEAYDAGNLETTPEQQVMSEGDTIAIQPAQPDTVYVPTYNPTTVYGAQPAPSKNYYPTVYTAPPASSTTYVTQPATTSSTDSAVSFGVGALVGGLLTAAIMWDKDDKHYHYRGIYYGGPGYYGRPGYWARPGYWDQGYWRRPEVSHYGRRGDVNIKTGDINIDRSRNRVRAGKWEHNPTHRGGVRYRDASTRQRYTKTGDRTRVDRNRARGYEGRKPSTLGGRLAGTQPRQRVARAEQPRTQRGAAGIKRPERQVQRKAPRAQSQTRAQRSTTRETPRRATTQQRPSTTRQKPAQRSQRLSSRSPSSGRRSSAFQSRGSGRSARAASSRGAASRAARGGSHGGTRGSGLRGGGGGR